MITVRFYDNVNDELLKFAVIIARSQEKWVFCKHRDRTTYECPGGHREANEDIVAAAKRELFEETGAINYSLSRLCIYSVTDSSNTSDAYHETYGMLYYADINEFGELPDYEIEQVHLFDELPDNWTYPEIQPKLIEKALEMMMKESNK